MPVREHDAAGESWRREKLPAGSVAYVTAVHGFQTDALRLAKFARPCDWERVCDLGTGCGSIPLLWFDQGLCPQVDGVDIQPEAIRLAAASARENGWEDRFRLFNEDWRQCSLPPGIYDRVICNPPYFAAGTGEISRSRDRGLARHEVRGRLCVCHRPERLVDLLAALRGAGLEPKRIRWVQRRADTPPWLLLCEARKEGRPGLRTEPVWIEDVVEEERVCPDN